MKVKDYGQFKPTAEQLDRLMFLIEKLIKVMEGKKNDRGTKK